MPPTVVMAFASSPTIVVAPTASVPSHLDDVTIGLVDHRLLLGDRHRRSIQRRNCSKRQRRDANAEYPSHQKILPCVSVVRGTMFQWLLSSFYWRCKRPPHRRTHRKLWSASWRASVRILSVT